MDTVDRIGERLARIESKIDGLKEDAIRAHAEKVDHETRLRALEKWRYSLPLSLLASVGALIGTVLQGAA